MSISPTYEDAELVVVNTCGFIDSAVQESLDAIGEALEENGKVIVTGCLGAKADVVREAHPKVLAVTGPHATEDVMRAVHAHLPQAARSLQRSRAAAGHPVDAPTLRVPEDRRRLQSPMHLLHHPFDARRPRKPPDRRSHAARRKRSCARA